MTDPLLLFYSFPTDATAGVPLCNTCRLFVRAREHLPRVVSPELGYSSSLKQVHHEHDQGDH
jgi:hypothetical protein